MLYLPDWKVSFFAIPGCVNESLFEYLQGYYMNKENIKQIPVKDNIWQLQAISRQPLFINIDQSYKVGFIRNPFYRMLALYKSASSDPILSQLPHTTFEEFVSVIYQNKARMFNMTDKKNMATFSRLLPQLHILTSENGHIPLDLLIIDDDMTTAHVNKFLVRLNLPDAHLNQLKRDLSNMAPVDYMTEYTLETIKMVYSIYKEDFEYFDFPFPLHLMQKDTIVRGPLNKSPAVFTIITPTMGNKSIHRLKKSLSFEKVPFIHLILWDNNRVVNAVSPESLEDERTFCYQFKHPYHKYPNQRNDVWLRSVGISLTNTKYITFFDDDTWCNRGHLTQMFNFMTSKKLDYTYCKRRMWEDCSLVSGACEKTLVEQDCYHLRNIGVDDFEATGEHNKFGYTLLDNSSLYLSLDCARKLSQMFMENQVYGDDRLSKAYLDNAKFKGGKLEQVLVNHVAKPELVQFFRENTNPPDI